MIGFSDELALQHWCGLWDVFQWHERLRVLIDRKAKIAIPLHKRLEGCTVEMGQEFK